jgi:hypothetical protein
MNGVEQINNETIPKLKVCTNCFLVCPTVYKRCMRCDKHILKEIVDQLHGLLYAFLAKRGFFIVNRNDKNIAIYRKEITDFDLKTLEYLGYKINSINLEKKQVWLTIA